jgi:hypothetical protein
MSDEVDYYFREKPSNLKRRWMVICGCIILFVLVGLGYLAAQKPVITVSAGKEGIYVKNNGSTDALIYKVDGFWYRAGKVALLVNMPDIHQRVETGGNPIRLQIPDIPTPAEQTLQRSPVYMKLALRYKIPGIWIFRYTIALYFQYDSTHKTWASTKSIPPRYRSLGNLAMGKVDEIELSFH